MKKIYLIPVCLLITVYALAQQQIPLNEKQHVDSLENVLRSNGPDSAKANANFQLVEYWKFKDTVKSKTYLMRGKQLAAKYPYFRALAHFYEGQYYFNWNAAKAAAAFKKAEEAFSAFNTPKAHGRRAAAWFNYAIMNRDTKGYEFITRIILEKVLPEAEKAGEKVMLAHFYTQLSTVLMNNYQFAKAATYNQKAIELLQTESPRSTNLLFAYLSGVSIYCYDGKSAKAKPLLAKAKAIISAYPESVNYPLYYYNEALYYFTVKSFEQSLVSADKGIVLAKKYNQKQLHQQFLFRKYEVYGQQKAYAKARQILLDIAKDGTLMATANDKATIYAELSKTSKNLKDYKAAYFWMNKYQVLTDSIHKDQTALKINELETKYRTAENHQKIAALQAQNKQAALKARNEHLYNWLLVIGCLSLLITLGLVILNAKNNRKLAAQKEINYQQQLHELEQKQQLKVTKAMLDGEEHERERVARDLHDGLGGMLAGVKIGLSGWSNNNSDLSGDKDLNHIIGQLDSSVSELRRIARNLLPETLLKFGLEVALKDLCEFYMRDELHIDFQTFHIQKSITLSVQLSIYRMVQELFSNAIKHANASNIMLQCSQNDHIFFITFEDDGCGFDTAMLENKKGMGLDNLKNRITFLNGKFELQSVINEGTTINIELNINEDAKITNRDS
ncbi:sensor histidine kinase [Mucilaginibacter pocheonensis]|uniref:histidine kinase n=1 Tax=Mucilaginibacter pocheonensis TaxID=398050 RepID=A0ABU1TC00_9SPHI|nr:sensor histidine kinase [Mucilaginibacter pocheonensis]MDR6942922.1 signal transduction histidine kinase [Mucilaginibacter pocheonensis]